MAIKQTVASVIEKNRVSSEIPYLICLDVDVVDPVTGSVVETLYLVRNEENVVVNGVLYGAYKFDINFKNEAGEQPEVSVTSNDFSGAIQARMQQYAGGVEFKITMKIVRASGIIEEPCFVITPDVSYPRLQIDDFKMPSGDITFSCLAQCTDTSISVPSYQTLINYATLTKANDFNVVYFNDVNSLIVTIGDVASLMISGIDLTGAYAHRVGVTWVQATGALKVYIDGVLKSTQTVNAGYVFSSDGTLFCGHTQSSVGVPVGTTSSFGGLLGSYLAFDEVLTQVQIAELSPGTKITGSESCVLNARTDSESKTVIDISKSRHTCQIDNITSIGSANVSATINSPFELTEHFKVVSANSKNHQISWQLGADNPVTRRFPGRVQMRDRCSFVYKSEECGYQGVVETCDKSLHGANGCVTHSNGNRFGGFPGVTGGISRGRG